MRNNWLSTYSIGETKYAGEYGSIPEESIIIAGVDFPSEGESAYMDLQLLFDSGRYYFKKMIENENDFESKIICFYLDDNNEIRIIWTFDDSHTDTFQLEIFGSYIVTDQLIIEKTTGKLVLDITTKLKNDEINSVPRRIFVSNEFAYFPTPSNKKSFYRYDLINGSEMVVVTFPFEWLISSTNKFYTIVVNKGLELLCLEKDSFEELWRLKVNDTKDVITNIPLCIVGQTAYLINNEYLLSIDANTGDFISNWDYLGALERFGQEELKVKHCTNIASNGESTVLYLTGVSGLILVVDNKNNIQWVENVIRLQDIALAGSLIFSTENNYHIARDVKTGDVVWKTKYQSFCNHVMYGDNAVAYFSPEHGIEIYK